MNTKQLIPLIAALCVGGAAMAADSATATSQSTPVQAKETSMAPAKDTSIKSASAKDVSKVKKAKHRRQKNEKQAEVK